MGRSTPGTEVGICACVAETDSRRIPTVIVQMRFTLMPPSPFERLRKKGRRSPRKRPYIPLSASAAANFTGYSIFSGGEIEAENSDWEG